MKSPETRLRVLVAEHNERRASLLRRHLEQDLSGRRPAIVAECAVALSRLDALRQLRSGKFDLVVVDWVWTADDDPEGAEKYRYGAEIAEEARAGGARVGVVTQVMDAQQEAASNPDVDFVIHRNDLAERPNILAERVVSTLEEVGSIVKNVDPRRVFVVYGHDAKTLKGMRDFLRDLDLLPISFDVARKETQQVSQGAGRVVTTLDVVQHAITSCSAVIVLLTPDDTVSSSAGGVRNRARQNVVFEAGLAFSRLPSRTVLVKFGDVEEFSDVDGVQYFAMTNSQESRVRFRDWLLGLDLPVSDADESWRKKRYGFPL